MSATGQNPPKREIGSGVSNSARVYWPGSGVPGWSAFTADEHVPELLGSNEIPTYDQMLTNPQLWALFIGLCCRAWNTTSGSRRATRTRR
jgi:hypothetical protein